MRAVEKRIPLAVAGVVILAAVAGLLASLPPPPGAGADPAGSKIYWTDLGTAKIQRADLDGSNVEELVTALGDPIGIALDAAGGKMYWTDIGTDKIQRADLDGGNVEDLVTSGLMGPEGIALDVLGGKMYWVNVGFPKIQRADLDGSNVEDLVTSGLMYPEGIALDVSGGKMYWTDYGTQKIHRADMADGSNVEDVVTGLDEPWGIALDVGGGKMYWTDPWAQKIQRADMADGGNVQNLVTGLPAPFAIALDVSGGKMYWTDPSAQKIQRADLSGSNVEDLVTGLGIPIGIALDIGAVVPGCEPDIDTDYDGFDNDVECYLGTDPLDNCPDDPSDDAWPADVDNSTRIDIVDLNLFVLNIGFLYRDPEWSPAIQRLDLNRDGGISTVGDVMQFLFPMFFQSCNGGTPHPPSMGMGPPVTLGIDPEITGNTDVTLGALEACVRVNVDPGDMDNGVPDHTIDLYVADAPLPPTGYDAWVIYDPNRVDPVDWDDLVKLPGGSSSTNKMPSRSRLNTGGYLVSGNGTPGDGTIVRIDLDAISDGPACFDFAIAFGKYASPGLIHPTVARAAMLAINEECPTEDLDGDDIFDICDNCLDEYNPAQIDIDGDGLGNACDNCPLEYNPLQENMDGDAWGDACEVVACIDVATGWVTYPGDSDCDGFTDDHEGSIGTDPNVACGVAAWPPDFDDSNWVDIYDVNILKPAYGSSYPGPPYDVQFDLYPDTWIDIFDVNRLKVFFYHSCTP